ncbi:hypothetical protein [Streptomyces sp. NPDC005438]|uniref:hypothetical protein n=1 Tax=Streptomyces sp. NPDC005438 TaxID=3156880 RepID=UPI0033A3B935
MRENGVLEEALRRLHHTGPERRGRLSNHGPMVVEALAHGGQQARVHRWLDRYQHRTEEPLPRRSPIVAEDWRLALGDPGRLADWTDHFTRAVEAEPWRDLLVRWWPRLLPGLLGGSTHPTIRVGHAVRALRAWEAGPDPDPECGRVRRAELAHGLAYWAARHHPVPGLRYGSRRERAGAALEATPPVPDPRGPYPARVAQVETVPRWPASPPRPERVPGALTELVTAAVRRYARHAEGDPVMLVHAATAPEAVRRVLPELPPALWVPSLYGAWRASASVTAAYPAHGVLPRRSVEPYAEEELLARAATHGDAHTVKFTDTAVEVLARSPGDGDILLAVERARELIDPAE